MPNNIIKAYDKEGGGNTQVVATSSFRTSNSLLDLMTTPQKAPVSILDPEEREAFDRQLDKDLKEGKRSVTVTLTIRQYQILLALADILYRYCHDTKIKSFIKEFNFRDIDEAFRENEDMGITIQVSITELCRIVSGKDKGEEVQNIEKQRMRADLEQLDKQKITYTIGNTRYEDYFIRLGRGIIQRNSNISMREITLRRVFYDEIMNAGGYTIFPQGIFKIWRDMENKSLVSWYLLLRLMKQRGIQILHASKQASALRGKLIKDRTPKDKIEAEVSKCFEGCLSFELNESTIEDDTSTSTNNVGRMRRAVESTLRDLAKAGLLKGYDISDNVKGERKYIFTFNEKFISGEDAEDTGEAEQALISESSSETPNN